MKKLNYSFQLATSKKKPKKTYKFTMSKKNVPAVCKLIDGEFQAIIHNGLEQQYGIPFTKESFDLRGREKVFGINDGIVYLRNKDYAKAFPGLDTQYVALRDNYDIVGDIVMLEGKRLFNLKEVLNIHKDE